MINALNTITGQKWWRPGAADDVWQALDLWSIVDCEAGTEIVPKGDAELLAGFAKAEEGIATGAPSL